jgi:DNA-binding transcriptional regulator YiaG
MGRLSVKPPETAAEVAKHPITHETIGRSASQGCNPRERITIYPPDWSTIRTTLGLSIRDFAGLTGINRGDLSKIERGHASPTPKQASRLLEAWWSPDARA